MMFAFFKWKNTIWYKLCSMCVMLSFIASLCVTTGYAQNTIHLPAPGAMVSLSPAFNPVVIQGLKVFPENPLQFEFIVDPGDQFTEDANFIKNETQKLIRYFLTSLTFPEEEMWVNLSPYEADRIVPERFGQTEMGRDVLAQDYMLKQITASMMHPEGKLGKAFWERIQAKAHAKYGTNIPVDTFNKVWIVPETAEIYTENNVALITHSHLKVMLEEDYLALENHRSDAPAKTNTIGSDLIREIIILELEREINNGKNFAPLRQIYNSMILATWYKYNVQDSIVNQLYTNHRHIAGIESDEKDTKEKIYQMYTQAFEQGAYNYISEQYNPETQDVLPQKYFSGGVQLSQDGAAAMAASKKGRSLLGRLLKGVFRVGIMLSGLGGTAQGVEEVKLKDLLDEQEKSAYVEIVDIKDVDPNAKKSEPESLKHKMGSKEFNAKKVNYQFKRKFKKGAVAYDMTVVYGAGPARLPFDITITLKRGEQEKTLTGAEARAVYHEYLLYANDAKTANEIADEIVGKRARTSLNTLKSFFTGMKGKNLSIYKNGGLDMYVTKGPDGYDLHIKFDNDETVVHYGQNDDGSWKTPYVSQFPKSEATLQKWLLTYVPRKGFGYQGKNGEVARSVMDNLVAAAFHRINPNRYTTNPQIAKTPTQTPSKTTPKTPSKIEFDPSKLFGFSGRQSEIWQNEKQKNTALWKQIKALADGNNSFYKKEDGEMGEYDALVYLVTGDQKYAQNAFRHMMRMATSKPDRNYTRDRFLRLAKLYGQIKAGLEPEQREAIKAKLDIWTNLVFLDSFNKNGEPKREPIKSGPLGKPHGTRLHDSDELVGHYFGAYVYALAIRDEDPDRSKEILDRLEKWRATIKRYATLFTGGVWMESSDYNYNTTSYLADGIYTINAILGEDMFPEYTEIWPDWAKALVYSLTPNFRKSFQWGDVQNPGYIYRHPALQMMALASFLSDDPLAYHVFDQWLNHPNKKREAAVGRWIFYVDPIKPREAPQGWSVHNAEGMGFTAAHTGWGADDYLFTVITKPKTGVDHQSNAFQDFMLFKGNRRVIGSPIVYGAYHYEQMYNNGFMVHRAFPLIGQENKGQIDFKDGGDYVYHAARADGRNQRGKSDEIGHYTRQFLFHEGVIVTHDIVQASSLPTLSQYREEVRWMLNKDEGQRGHVYIMHTPEDAVQEGNSYVWKGENGDRVVLTPYWEHTFTVGPDPNRGVKFKEGQKKRQLRLFTKTPKGRQNLLTTINPTNLPITVTQRNGNTIVNIDGRRFLFGYKNGEPVFQAQDQAMAAEHERVTSLMDGLEPTRKDHLEQLYWENIAVYKGEGLKQLIGPGAITVIRGKLDNLDDGQQPFYLQIDGETVADVGSEQVNWTTKPVEEILSAIEKGLEDPNAVREELRLDEKEEAANAPLQLIKDAWEDGEHERRVAALKELRKANDGIEGKERDSITLGDFLSYIRILYRSFGRPREDIREIKDIPEGRVRPGLERSFKERPLKESSLLDVDEYQALGEGNDIEYGFNITFRLENDAKDPARVRIRLRPRYPDRYHLLEKYFVFYQALVEENIPVVLDEEFFVPMYLGEYAEADPEAPGAGPRIRPLEKSGVASDAMVGKPAADQAMIAFSYYAGGLENDWAFPAESEAEAHKGVPLWDLIGGDDSAYKGLLEEVETIAPHSGRIVINNQLNGARAKRNLHVGDGATFVIPMESLLDNAIDHGDPIADINVNLYLRGDEIIFEVTNKNKDGRKEMDWQALRDKALDAARRGLLLENDHGLLITLPREGESHRVVSVVEVEEMQNEDLLWISGLGQGEVNEASARKTGLGLPKVKRTFEQSNYGDIEVETGDGYTTFRLVYSKADESKVEPEAPNELRDVEALKAVLESKPMAYASLFVDDNLVQVTGEAGENFEFSDIEDIDADEEFLEYIEHNPILIEFNVEDEIEVETAKMLLKELRALKPDSIIIVAERPSKSLEEIVAIEWGDATVYVHRRAHTPSYRIASGGDKEPQFVFGETGAKENGIVLSPAMISEAPAADQAMKASEEEQLRREVDFYGDFLAANLKEGDFDEFEEGHVRFDVAVTRKEKLRDGQSDLVAETESLVKALAQNLKDDFGLQDVFHTIDPDYQPQDDLTVQASDLDKTSIEREVVIHFRITIKTKWLKEDIPKRINAQVTRYKNKAEALLQGGESEEELRIKFINEQFSDPIFLEGVIDAKVEIEAIANEPHENWPKPFLPIDSDEERQPSLSRIGQYLNEGPKDDGGAARKALIDFLEKEQESWRSNGYQTGLLVDYLEEMHRDASAAAAMTTSKSTVADGAMIALSSGNVQSELQVLFGALGRKEKGAEYGVHYPLEVEAGSGKFVITAYRTTRGSESVDWNDDDRGQLLREVEEAMSKAFGREVTTELTEIEADRRDDILFDLIFGEETKAGGSASSAMTATLGTKVEARVEQRMLELLSEDDADPMGIEDLVEEIEAELSTGKEAELTDFITGLLASSSWREGNQVQEISGQGYRVVTNDDEFEYEEDNEEGGLERVYGGGSPLTQGDFDEDRDWAMNAKEPIGGIDLDPAKLKLNMIGEPIKMTIPENIEFYQQLFQQPITPQILHMTPVLNFSSIFDQEPTEDNTAEDIDVIDHFARNDQL